MDYAASQERLLREFGRLGFMQAFQAGEFHKWEYRVDTLHIGSVVKIVFPGAKTQLSPPRYDYRVDIVKQGIQTSLSHANIIVDIYNKGQRQKPLIPELRSLLANIIPEGPVDPYQGTRRLRNYESLEPPDSSLLDRIEQVHVAQGKPFNRVGNQWDLSIEELICVVKWIALQEDINYPTPQCEGRKMAFARYAEAIHCAERNADVALVVKRALAHRRPSRWHDVDYGMVDRA